MYIGTKIKTYMLGFAQNSCSILNVDELQLTLKFLCYNLIAFIQTIFQLRKQIKSDSAHI